MKARSTKTAARDRVYLSLRRVFLIEYPTCEARLDGCTGLATEVHHMVGRYPSVFFRVEWWRALCHHCHAWATVHPKLARHLGLSLHSSAAGL